MKLSSLACLLVLVSLPLAAGCAGGGAASDKDVVGDSVASDQLDPEVQGDVGVADGGDTGGPWSCANLPPLPVEVSSLPGFTGAEDFAFDDKGRVVSVDTDGSLVRQTIDGGKKLWVPNIGSDAAGVRFLPGGDLMVNSVGTGGLLRVTPEGGYSTVVSGLRYPNGIEVDLEGFVYVSEHDAGRIRRVDPDTGDFSIIAEGLFNPNGLTFSPDYQTLYCGSFGGGVVYAVDRDDAGGWAPVRLFARTPGAPTDDCETRAENDECVSLGGWPGVCAYYGEALMCAPRGPCDGKVEGDDCELWGSAGTCLDLEGLLDCVPDTGCEGKAEGDDCDAWGAPGVCTLNGDLLECIQKLPCEGKGEGDDCNSYGTPGTCQTINDYFDCVPKDPCEGKAEGDDCLSWGSAGKCQLFDGILQCQPKVPCQDAAPGEVCDNYGVPGACVDLNGYLECLGTTSCTGKQAGDPCDDGGWYPLDGNSPKKNEMGGGYTCEAHDGALVCVYRDPCYGKEVGDACPASGNPGLCKNYDGYLACEAVYPCDSLQEGNVCWVGPYSGLCLSNNGYLDCLDPSFCADLAEGDACNVWGVEGKCTQRAGHLLCLAKGDPGTTGGLDGIGVDTCGNLYVTEYVLGLVWRFPPAGSVDSSKAELVLTTGASWIPNVHWGSGLGGWDPNVMYVMNRDNGSLFALEVGVPTKALPYPPTPDLTQER
jgi:sugar lactone lactonase YvrE